MISDNDATVELDECAWRNANVLHDSSRRSEDDREAVIKG